MVLLAGAAPGHWTPGLPGLPSCSVGLLGEADRTDSLPCGACRQWLLVPGLSPRAGSWWCWEALPAPGLTQKTPRLRPASSPPHS